MVPARAAKGLSKRRIGQFPLGDCCCAPQSNCLGAALSEQAGVHLCIHTTDKETADGTNVRQVLRAIRKRSFQTRNVRFHYFGVTIQTKDQRYVDASTLGDHLRDGW